MVHRRLPDGYADDTQEFGRQVRAAREARGWSLDTLVAKTGHAVNKKTLARIERGYTDDEVRSPANPELRVLVELCKALGGRITIDLARPTAFAIDFDPSHGDAAT